MKLLFCEKCQDVFKLRLDEMRHCACGEVYGRYVTNSQAEVSPNAVSIAIGNGSLYYSIAEMKTHQAHSGDTAKRHEYYKPGQGKIEYAWVRPNSGSGNPHTKVIDLKLKAQEGNKKGNSKSPNPAGISKEGEKL